MNWIDKLRNRLSRSAVTETQTQVFVEQVRDGERMEKAMLSADVQTLFDLVIDPLERQAYVEFKKVDPADKNAVMQTQKLSMAIDIIKARAEGIIIAGKNAANFLATNSTPEEGEPNA